MFHRVPVCIAARMRIRHGDYSCCTPKLRSIAFCSAASRPVRRAADISNGNQAGRSAQLDDNAARHRWLADRACSRSLAIARRPRRRARADDNEAGDLSIELVDPKVLRVCADPRNLPFSNEKGEGFENKLAELFAEKLQKKLDYMYFPQATGFVRMTLGAHRCDVIMGFPQGDDLVQGTNPYYRTAYALVAKQGSGLEDVDDAGRRAPEGQAYRHRRRHAARHQHGGQRPDGERQAISADDRYALRFVGGGHDRRSRRRARSTPAFCGDRWRASMRRRRTRRFMSRRW